LTLLDASKEAPDRLPDTLADPAAMMKLARGIVAYRKTGAYLSDGQRHAADFRVHNVSFSGLIGEPLVARMALVPAMSYLVDHDLRVGIFTNGVLMDDRVIDTFVRIAYVHLSLDAATGETYTGLKFRGRQAGVAKFERAVANLRSLVERRRADPDSTRRWRSMSPLSSTQRTITRCIRRRDWFVRSAPTGSVSSAISQGTSCLTSAVAGSPKS
jgi:hypothetical protein